MHSGDRCLDQRSAARQGVGRNGISYELRAPQRDGLRASRHQRRSCSAVVQGAEACHADVWQADRRPPRRNPPPMANTRNALLGNAGACREGTFDADGSMKEMIVSAIVLTPYTMTERSSPASPRRRRPGRRP
jgi:hypothetical protein